MKKNTSLEILHLLSDPNLGHVEFDLDSFEFLKNSNLKKFKFFDSNSNDIIEEKMSQELEMNQNLIELETNTKIIRF
jgi:hypothetical protein